MEEVWKHQLLNEFLPNNILKKMKLFGNNKISLNLTKDFESQNYIKHIDDIYYHVLGLIKDRKLVIKWISSSNMLANSLLKAFLIKSFRRYQKEWGLVKKKVKSRRDKFG